MLVVTHKVTVLSPRQSLALSGPKGRRSRHLDSVNSRSQTQFWLGKWILRYTALSHVWPMVLVRCRGSRGLLGTVLLCAGTTKSRVDKRVGKRDVAPVLICRSQSAIRSTRIWLRSFWRISPMLRRAFTRCPSTMTDLFLRFFIRHGFFLRTFPPSINGANPALRPKCLPRTPPASRP